MDILILISEAGPGIGQEQAWIMARWEGLGIVSNTSITFTCIYYLGNGPSYNGSSGD
jgi:hypothetical protein